LLLAIILVTDVKMKLT